MKKIKKQIKGIICFLLCCLILSSCNTKNPSSKEEWTETTEIKAFTMQTGDYIISYDPTDTYIHIRKNGGDSEKSLAFDPGHGNTGLLQFSKEHLTEMTTTKDKQGQTVVLHGTWVAGNYSVGIFLPADAPGCIKTWTDIQCTKSIDKEQLQLGIPGEYIYIKNGRRFLPETTTYFDIDTGFPVKQKTWRADLNQLVYFGDHEVLDATVFYYADFTDLNSYFKLSGTEMFQSISMESHEDIVTQPDFKNGNSGRFGMMAPLNQNEIPAGETVRISSSVLCLKNGVEQATSTTQAALKFIQSYQDVFYHIQRPDKTYYNWEKIAEATVEDVSARLGKKAIYHYGGDLNFNLLSFLEYFQTFMPERVETQMEESIRRIWVQDSSTYQNDKGSTGIFGWYKDREGAANADFWQGYTWPCALATEFSIRYNDKELQQAMIRNSAVLMDTARDLDYTFSVFVNVNTGERVETGYDMDYGNAGGYVYNMVLFYELTNDPVYLEEAKKAAEKLATFGLGNVGFEMNVTAQSAYALLKLYQITNNEAYLAQSYIQVASVLKHTWLFNPQYGKFEGRNLFMNSSARANLCYANPAEEAMIIKYFYSYLKEGDGILDPAVSNMVAEVLSWKQLGCADAIPALHANKDVIQSEKPQFWQKINPDGYIGLEPYGHSIPEWKLGALDECNYGISMNFELAMKQIHVLGDGRLYTDAPVSVEYGGNGIYSLKLLGLQHENRIGLNFDDCILVREDGTVIESFGKSEADDWNWYLIEPNQAYQIQIGG